MNLSSAAPLGALAIALLENWKASGASGLLFLSESERRAEHLGAILAALDPDCGVMVLPRWDCLPYDGTPPSREVSGRRASVLRRLAQGGTPPLVLTTPDSALQRVPPKQAWKDAVLELRPDSPISEQALAAYFGRTGYVLVPRVETPGEASLRGQVVDIFPAGGLGPVRVEHSAGRITGLLSYDPDTQRTNGDVAGLVLDAASEIIHARQPQETAPAPGAGSLLAHYGTLATLFDYLPRAHVLADAGVAARTLAWLRQIQESYDARRLTVVPADDPVAVDPPSRIFLDEPSWNAALAEHDTVVLAAGPPAAEILVPAFATEASPARAFQAFIKDRLGANYRVLLTAATEHDLKIMARRAGKSGAGDFPRANSLAQALAAADASRRPVVLRVDLENGFVLRERKTAVLAAADLLGSRADHEVLMGSRDQPTQLDETRLTPGDLVVHRERGLAILRGLESVSAADLAASDMVRLEFAAQKTVLLPVEDLASIWKYGSEAEGVTLDRADGSTWAERRNALEDELATQARQLVTLARERQSRTAAVLVPPAARYERFAARFPHFATPDQARAIQDVLDDLASGHPMDRLVCGDVGFGKTEVALRAAAAAAFSGKQVAVVVPTTVLARQHVRTFRQRFAGFGLEIGHLSRFAGAGEARAVKKGVADGSIRIVIGTHAIGAKDIRFRDLGLLIIDEEQRFGTEDKEKLRGLAEPLHVLNTTATPIPRTLRLATVGLQQFSAITTPPTRRLPVRTAVAKWDPVTIARALRYEHQRGGQSFVVCPRIKDIAPLREQLGEIVPELDVLALHGRMPTATIDETMLAFAQGQGNVLLTTNIVESGLDIPRANTIIVSHPERFGLAQLHQLRGRIGRGSRRGFAYFLLDPAAKSEAKSARRLQLLEENGGLAAGFAISEHDMNLRGAGSLLGEQQSGHLKLVGPELYRHLFERAVRTARGERIADDGLPDLHIGVHGSIPLDYVGDQVIRLEIYARLAKADSEQALDSIEEELEDRFGPAPCQLQNLLAVARIRLRCSRLGISRVDAGPQGTALSFRDALPRLGKRAKQFGLRCTKDRLLQDEPTRPDQRLEKLSVLLEKLEGMPHC